MSLLKHFEIRVIQQLSLYLCEQHKTRNFTSSFLLPFFFFMLMMMIIIFFFITLNEILLLRLVILLMRLKL